MRREMFESEAKNGHRGVFELLHLSEKASSAGMASLAPREFPLYYSGKELKPFQYALFLLSKVCLTHIHKSCLLLAWSCWQLRHLSCCCWAFRLQKGQNLSGKMPVSAFRSATCGVESGRLVPHLSVPYLPVTKGGQRRYTISLKRR